MAKERGRLVTARRKQRVARDAGLASGLGRVRLLEIEASYLKLYEELIRRARWKHKLSKDDASDVVQEAFLVALVKIGSVKKTRAWLEGVVDHLAINFLRTGERRARLLAFWGPGGDRIEEEAEETRDGS